MLEIAHELLDDIVDCQRWVNARSNSDPLHGSDIVGWDEGGSSGAGADVGAGGLMSARGSHGSSGNYASGETPKADQS